MRKFNNILVTGGAGFIGGNFIRIILSDSQFLGRVINYDKLTYAGNINSLVDIAKKNRDRYVFIKGDICDHKKVADVFQEYKIDCVVNFAAESHVDRSISGPANFIQTNLVGTFNLLEVARESWENRKDVLFHHISTDEVFGSLGKDGKFHEDTSYCPRSPYSATKAGSDHLVRAYYHTYNLPVTISNCSNNYGPYQFPEKLIPLMIKNALNGEKLPVYGDGSNVRDWLFVEDHVEAIIDIIRNGQVGRTWNIGGNNEWNNLELVKEICLIVAQYSGKNMEAMHKNIVFVEDRLGHDQRYAIDNSRITSELGWRPKVDFNTGIRKTIKWYLENLDWVENIESN